MIKKKNEAERVDEVIDDMEKLTGKQRRQICLEYFSGAREYSVKGKAVEEYVKGLDYTCEYAKKHGFFIDASSIDDEW